MNKLNTYNCPNCGASLNLKGDDIVCDYCKSHVIRQNDKVVLEGDIHAEEGIAYFKAKNFTNAIQSLEKAVTTGVSQNPMPRIFTILGNAYNNINNPDKAIATYERAIEIDPKYYKAWVAMGVAYVDAGKPKERERCYLKALEIEPNYAELHGSLGAMYIERGETDFAIASLHQALELKPGLAIAHGNLAVAYAMAGRFEEARSSLKMAVIYGYKQHKEVKARIEALESL